MVILPRPRTQSHVTFASAAQMLPTKPKRRHPTQRTAFDLARTDSPHRPSAMLPRAVRRGVLSLPHIYVSLLQRKRVDPPLFVITFDLEHLRTFMWARWKEWPKPDLSIPKVLV